MKPLASLTDEEFAERARQAAALPDAPPAFIQRAIGARAARPAQAPAVLAGSSAVGGLAAGLQAALRQLAAVLSFDSWAAPALATGLRGARAETRQLLFSSEGRDVDLRISPAEAAGRFMLTGQVLGPDETGLAQLAAAPQDSAGSAVATAAALHAGPLDTMGEFRLDGVAPGRYVLTLRVGGDEIVLPAFDVGLPPA